MPRLVDTDRATQLERARTAADALNECFQSTLSAGGRLDRIGEYTGGLASIPAAVERLRAAGVLDLVKPTAATAPATKPKDETVEPLYKRDPTACCPVHKRALSDGQYGLYCSARAKAGEAANTKGIARFDSPTRNRVR